MTIFTWPPVGRQFLGLLGFIVALVLIVSGQIPLQYEGILWIIVTVALML